MPTEQQLIGALRQADEAGDFAAAQRFAELIKQQRSANVPTDVSVSEPVSDMGAPGDAGLAQPAPQAVAAPAPVADDRLAIYDQLKAAMQAGDGEQEVAIRQQIESMGLPPNDPRGASVEKFGETAATMVTGALAEPAAGLAGIIQGLNPFADEGAAAEAVQATREALTFKPKTEAGAAGLQAFAETVAPVAKVFTEAEDALGDSVFEATGSETLAAAAKTFPTLALELLGVAGAKGAVRTGANAPRQMRAKALQGQIAREVADAVPTVDQLKDTSRAIYKEIDTMGASVKPKAYSGILNKINKAAQDMGVDPDITPKAAKALERFNSMQGRRVTLSELDTMRKVAQNAAKATEPADKAIGVAMINAVDDVMDSLSPSAFASPTGKAVKGVGEKYKAARTLWGRARRSEMVGEAFDRAKLQASGFENGIRVQFRSILNNKNKSKFFNAKEKAAMRRVVQGDKTENLAKLIGRFGFSEGNATNIVGGALGAGAGAAMFGPGGAMVVPVIGQVSRKLAQRMTRKNAEFADQIIRAGSDADKIARAYIKNTPKGARSSAELSELLLRPDIDLNNIKDAPLLQKAAQQALEQRAALGTVLAAPTEAANMEQEQPQ